MVYTRKAEPKKEVEKKVEVVIPNITLAKSKTIVDIGEKRAEKKPIGE